jgi:hypothetical protein
MGLSYAFVKVWAGEGDGCVEGARNLSPKDSIDYLMQPGVMRGEFLGACLDSCRIGTMTTCRWPTDVYGFMKLIDRWKEENGDDPALYHEKSIDEIYNKFELPWINHDSCPRDGKHLGTFCDLAGRIRCAHKTVEKIKPNFEWRGGPYWDFHAQMDRFDYSNNEPNEPGGDCGDEDYDVYLEEMRKFNGAEEVDVVDVCYSVIKDTDSPLALETILRRLNILPEKKTVYCDGNMMGACKRLDELSQKDRDWWGDLDWCHGHLDKLEAVEFTFDGWMMAHYLEKWRGQGDAPWFSREIERWPAREYLRICSQDC